MEFSVEHLEAGSGGWHRRSEAGRSRGPVCGGWEKGQEAPGDSLTLTTA